MPGLPFVLRLLRCSPLLLLAVVLGSCQLGSPPPERIILIVIDMLRRDHVGVYGGPPTPAMDGLAERGQHFSNATASFHQTTMSMGALFTGRTPSIESGDRLEELPWTSETWCGMARFRGASDEGSKACIPKGFPTVAALLGQAGYETMAIASNPLIFRPLGYERGFNRWIEVGDPRAKFGSDSVPHRRGGGSINDVARRIVASRRSDRFFLYLHYMDVHDYEWAGVSYAGSVATVDRAIGEILEHLEKEGLLEDSVVFVVSDHGELLGDPFPVLTARHYGNPSFEPLLRVPLIVSPAVFADTDQLVRSEDVPRLILEAAGLSMPGKRDLDEDEVFLSEQKWQNYRKGRWKSLWSRRDDSFFLFDLEAPSPEQKNVASEHPDLVAAHRARMEELAAGLAAEGSGRADLTEEEKVRLRSLGYLDRDD